MAYSGNFKMRQVLSFFTILIFCSCGEQTRQETSTQDKHVHDVDSIKNVDTLKKNTGEELTMLEWKKHEDSLRNEILKRKANKILKESFLQEMYIRNIVSVSKDSLFVTIPFNLHGADCGAPDCYSTDISFSFKFGDSLIFPPKFQFQEHERGCVDKERQLTETFQLVEQTNKHVIYHSPKYKRTLVLFSSNKENGTTAYYFTEVGRNKINGKNIYNIVKDYNMEDKNSIYPFTSWVLTTNGYEIFLYK